MIGDFRRSSVHVHHCTHQERLGREEMIVTQLPDEIEIICPYIGRSEPASSREFLRPDKRVGEVLRNVGHQLVFLREFVHHVEIGVLLMNGVAIVLLIVRVSVIVRRIRENISLF